jgi:type VI secretion system secreted protein VgrG
MSDGAVWMRLWIDGRDSLAPRLRDLRVDERLGRPTRAELEFTFDEDVWVDPSELLGVTVAVGWGDGQDEHHAAGVFVEVEGRRDADGAQRFVAAMVHRFGLLDRGRTCRVFVDVTLEDVLHRVLRERGWSEGVDYRIEFGEQRTPRPLLVQYHESDMVFLDRVLAEQGGAYRFDISEEPEPVIFIDGSSEAPRVVERAISMASQVGAGLDDDQGVIESATRSHRSRLQEVRRRDHRFESPLDPVEAADAVDVPGSMGTDFLYIDEGLSSEEVARLAGRRLDAAHADGEVCMFKTMAPSLFAGGLFDVEDHRHGGDYLGGYLAIAVEHRVVATRFGEAGGADDRIASYRNVCEAIPIERKMGFPWGATSADAGPRIHGVQTAVVVGDRDGELNVDRFGRVQVRFRWQTEGEEHPAPWVRIAHPWAGRGHGMIALPRVGHEVLLAFVDGDPDRPVVVGSLFNGESLVPETLPDEASRMVIRSQSLGGDRSLYNELHLDDRTGDERLYLRAARDLLVEVLQDATSLVERDARVEVKGARSATVGKDELVEARGIELVAENGITLRCGGSTIEISPSGITIKGTVIRLNC